MSIRKQILATLKDGALSIDEVCEAFPDLTRKQVGDALVQERLSGRADKKTENGQLVYFLTDAGRAVIVEKAEATPASALPPKKKTSRVAKKTKPEAKLRKVRQAKPPECAGGGASIVGQDPEPPFAAALAADRRLVVISDRRIIEFTQTQTAQIARALSGAA